MTLKHKIKPWKYIGGRKTILSHYIHFCKCSTFDYTLKNIKLRSCGGPVTEPMCGPSPLQYVMQPEGGSSGCSLTSLLQQRKTYSTHRAEQLLNNSLLFLFEYKQNIQWEGITKRNTLFFLNSRVNNCSHLTFNSVFTLLWLVWSLMDLMESSFFCFVELTCPLPSGVYCIFYSSLFFSVFQEWRIDKKKGTLNSWLHIATLYVFTLTCALMCALNWLTRYGSPCGRHQSIQPGLSFPERGVGGRRRMGVKERKKERKRGSGREGEDIDQVPCTSNSTFTWPSKLLASSPQYTTDVHASRAFFLPSSLHCPFVSAPCGFVHVCVYVSVCVSLSVCVYACLSCR